MADGGGGGRDRTEAVGDFPAQLLDSTGEHRTGLQDSHTSAQPGGAGMGLGEGLVSEEPVLSRRLGRGLSCSGSESSHAGKLGTWGLWRVAVQQWGPQGVLQRLWAEGCAWGSAGSAAPGSTGTPQALRPCQKRDLLHWGGIPCAKDSDNTRATPEGDFAYAARI